MPTETRPRRLAVLIDAENTSVRFADGLFSAIATIGETSLRRIYGDFSGTRSKGWADVLPKHAIVPQHQVAYTVGKNASDIALVIDAMDLLHSGRFDGFCVVSSDSDFTRLALRIREQGIDVFGFGEQKTCESFRQACRRFTYLETLLPSEAIRPKAGPVPAPKPQERELKAEEPKPVPAKPVQAKPVQAKHVHPQPVQPLSPRDALPILLQVLTQVENQDGWVWLSVLGKKLANMTPAFEPRNFGPAKLSELVRQTDAFDLIQPPGGTLRIRVRPTSAKLKVVASIHNRSAAPLLRSLEDAVDKLNTKA